MESAGRLGAKIKVIGVGGSGGNAVNSMVRGGLRGVEFIAANTDQRSLDSSLASTTIPLGKELTKGRGAGAIPEIGYQAALEDYSTISSMLSGADMVFITAGMGGGTGTGAAPVFAKISKEMGALTIGVVTKPFLFEGKRRMRHAEEGIGHLEEYVDSLITIPNQQLIPMAGREMTMLEAFLKADGVLLDAVQSVTDLINRPGMINCDFADVETVMRNKGLALMGIGHGEGKERAVTAGRNAISSPLLDGISINGATGVIINVTGGNNLKMCEVETVTSLVTDAVHSDADIIFGMVIDEALEERIAVTVIATGLAGTGLRVSNLLN